MGYAGGKTPSPTYQSIGDHTESIQIVYDPKVISYGDLLTIFWDSHSPTSRPYGKQYMSLIFAHSKEQRKEAVKSMKNREKELGKRIFTQIKAAEVFTPAEDYHQKYYLKSSTLLKDLNSFYPTEKEITHSTAAARINGYLAGYGTFEALMEEIELFGLSKKGKEDLIRRVGPREPGKVSSLFSTILKACGISPTS